MKSLPLLVAVMGLWGCAGGSTAPGGHDPDHTRAAASAPAPAKVAEFQGEFRFLSNFWPATIDFDRISSPTLDHAFQSAKTLYITPLRRIASLPSPADAKREGRAL